MANKAKRKRRLTRSLARRRKEGLKRAWRNIFVKKGILKQ
jgi:hypothetical protein